jgi:hypothetical protein
MNLPDLHDKLIRSARLSPPDDRVPYAFEKRITALIKDRVAERNRNSWVHGLWRAALSCVVIAFMCGAWMLFYADRSATSAEDFSQNFENTLLASVDQNDATP